MLEMGNSKVGVVPPGDCIAWVGPVNGLDVMDQHRMIIRKLDSMGLGPIISRTCLRSARTKGSVWPIIVTSYDIAYKPGRMVGAPTFANTCGARKRLIVISQPERTPGCPPVCYYGVS